MRVYLCLDWFSCGENLPDAPQTMVVEALTPGEALIKNVPTNHKERSILKEYKTTWEAISASQVVEEVISKIILHPKPNGGL